MRHTLSTLWFWHSLCCLLTLLSCVAILWPQVFLPDAWETRIITYAGTVVLVCLLASLLLLAITAITMLLHLRYRSALRQLLIWGSQWALCAAIFILLAWMADVPPPNSRLAEDEPQQAADNVSHTPGDVLTGPNALFIPLPQGLFSEMAVDNLAPTPNLLELENKHSELLEKYLNQSPRWALYMDDDTFYSKPGHVVMTPTGNSSGIQGLVHVAFRHLVEGDPLPAGYTIIKPGAPMPTRPEGSEQVDDLAVDLGLNHYLLLAWRGTSHTETAYRALNAALTTVDAMVQPLAHQPTEETLQQMLVGKRNIISDTPVMLLSQPPAQYGAYQAELYVNPGEPGTLLLRIADAETDTPLRIFNCPALYSDTPGELFRHDIPPLNATQTVANSLFQPIPGHLPVKAPLFTIKIGEAHQFFDVVFELWFQPAARLKPRRMLLRHVYRVQAYEVPVAASESADNADEQSEIKDSAQKE